MEYPMLYILFCGLLTFVISQFFVSNIGNRQYSFFCKSHFLLKRKGILKLIYYKPKHFHRYSIFEVFFFFYSFASLFSSILLIILNPMNMVSDKTSKTLIVVILIFVIFVGVFWILLNDITNYYQEKFYKLNYKKTFNEYIDDLVKNNLISANRSKKNLRLLYYLESINKMYEINKSYEKELSQMKDLNIEKVDKLDDKYINYYKNYKKF